MTKKERYYTCKIVHLRETNCQSRSGGSEKVFISDRSPKTVQHSYQKYLCLLMHIFYHHKICGTNTQSRSGGSEEFFSLRSPTPGALPHSDKKLCMFYTFNHNKMIAPHWHDIEI